MRNWLRVFTACVVLLSAVDASAQADAAAKAKAAKARADAKARAPIIKRSNRNTLEFDHLNLQTVSDAPTALEIGDGELFQVVVTKTDPRVFKYTISATQDESGPPSSGLAANATPVRARTDGRANLTMRHDQHFSRYRVSITLLPGVTPGAASVVSQIAAEPKDLDTLSIAPETPSPTETGDVGLASLYPVAFDVWVITRPQWKPSFSGGFAWSSLMDPKYYIKTDAAGKKTVEEDIAAEAADGPRYDVVAVANLYFDHQFKRSLMFGAMVGVGDNGAGSPRIYLGPSVVLGQNFIFSGGLAIGRVAALPTGQVISQPPINGDNTLNALGSRSAKGGFFSVAFTFINRESEFKGAFSSTTTTPAAVPALSLADIEGDYWDGTTVRATVKATKKDGKQSLPLTLTLTKGNATVSLTKEKAALDYTDDGATKEAKFSGAKADVKLDYSDSADSTKLSLKKKPSS